MDYKFNKNMTVLGHKIRVSAPSKTQYKKYDVRDRETNKKLFSFGDNRYQHYFDKLGYYSNLNHNDKKRRDAYRARHKNDKLNELSAGYFSWHYLW